MKKLLMLAAIFGMTYAATAQEKTDTAQPQSEAISQIHLANQLAKYGYENYSATALIEAARILSGVETQSLKSESFTPGEGDESAKDSAKPEFTPENLLASAKEFADGDETLLALANSVQISKSEDHRGLLGGPGRRVDRVAANSTDTYVLAFKYGVRPKFSYRETAIPTWICTSMMRTGIALPTMMTTPMTAMSAGHLHGPGTLS